jgi:hypothetical protein
MPSYINGIDTTLITGLGQIGVSPTSSVNIPTSGTLGGGGYTSTALLTGETSPAPNFYRLITSSVFSKIEIHSQAVFLLSSSGELFSIGLSSIYTGTGTTSFAKVTTGSNGWTDISAGQNFAIGICNGKLFAIGINSNGQFGNGGTTSVFSNFTVVNSDTDWTKISCGNAHSVAIKGGTIYTAGSNGNGRTGRGTISGNTTTWSTLSGSLSGSTGWTDCSAGNETTLAISGGDIFGTGEAGAYQLGNNSTTDLLFFTLLSGSGIWSQSFAFGNFSKAITTNSFHYHAGAKSYVTGDGSTGGTFLTWSRVGSDDGWSYFAGEKFSTNTQYGTIGIKSGSLFYIGQNGVDAWKPNSTFTGYITGSNHATWMPILTSSRKCTAAYVGGSVTNATLIMSLQPL